MKLVLLCGVVALLAVGCSSGVPSEPAAFFDHLNENGLTCPEPAAGPDTEMRTCKKGDDDAVAFVSAKGDSVEVEIQRTWLETLGGDPEVILGALGAVLDWPAGAVGRMATTRPLDGTQRDGDVSWSVTDDGLVVVSS